MPLRFRSVVPYTLPGVLALIGWWWYISRKKERLISHGSPEGAPTDTAIITSPAEGSNGLVEKGTISPTNDTECHTNTSPNVTSQKTDNENISHIHVQDTEAAPLLRQGSDEGVAHPGRIREEVLKPSVLTQPSSGKEETLLVSLKDNKDVEESLSFDVVIEPEEQQLKDPASALASSVEEVILPCQSNEVTISPTTTTYLSDAERPEPEGEVAKHHSTINTQDEVIVCAVTPAKLQRVVPSEAVSQDTPPSLQDFHQHILTSTPATADPTAIALTTAQESLTLSVTPEDIQMQSNSGGEQDLELLAAGLIYGVISAATQEILGVTRCQITDNSQPSCSSGNNSSPPLASSRQCSKQEPITTTQQQHHLLTSSMPINGESTETPGKEQQGMTNGCSSAPVWEPVEISHRDHETDNDQAGHWPTATQDAAQSMPLLNMKLTGDEAAVLAEDSACSTCHSEDGISSEDLHNSTLDNQIDVIQVTDLSEKEAEQTQSLAETSTEAAGLPVTDENSVDSVCEIKRLNGVGLRNGAHGTCDMETDQDQSGGSDVNSMDSVDSGCTMGTGESQSNHAASLTSELAIWEIEVPKHLVGRLIGKQGRFVSFIKQNSGAKIYISTLPYTQDFQICHIEGAQQQVDKALSLIGKKFKDLDMTNLYAPPPPALTLPSLPMTSWLLLPSGVTVEVIVVNIVSAGHVFVQQHTHPTYHALRSLDQQMFLCYSQPGTPALPSPVEVGVICAAPAVEGAWWRAQVITFYKESNEVEIRYVDYGGYDRVKIDSLRQIRSDFVTLPFQGAEVLLDNIAPLPGEDRFSPEATSALEEMTRAVPLLAQVSSYDNNTGLPLVHLWNMVGDEVISVNRTLAERSLGVWVEGFLN